MKFSKTLLYTKLSETPIMPLFNHPDVEKSKAVVKACYNGGIRVFEYTNRGVGADKVFGELVKYIRTDFPDMAIGIGTIFNAQEAEYFVSLDTDFIVQPTLDAGVANVCQQNNMAWFPGVLTPNEIYKANQLGADIVKIFPANVLSPSFVKSVKTVMPQVEMMITGGVEPNEQSLTTWFNAGAKAVGMGGQLFPKAILDDNNFNWIENTVKECLSVIKN
ncbi:MULTISPECIES: bifunctional 4-hydroxy-2-oxoglutarate aldolase/2-dehydro-3-deoxy-phosphogluconate aldolase [unclassified Arcicella]|uniref:bifunctional 4-hydroxy-2-oxoglutarate aldolase/2-dehydro-3-deoxy-phosphogluconate aldolase n=1 Tax=unclassified Arcicella TaxID=2644986 RepID=UPI002866496F|nr:MULTISPECIES: bifunctional 4-hydroxy-2-oxoglutarate aldolase/2-dehydro-3-deoxy-phosphogluconate aldolase [unclassified Arcicella]MDR6561316.1 2-dehydro-3-deoxyphosphogluconate aldolase/(4S)-4-hydroxy-2-oxoglutarate aldolase [Arcicella sp. BE51]MDR6811200.1 2-dehydro-3-deoxyphosphogluconate aldolase/(4S)-4-hydroxy-2-oxoglutarate aldolase [Arcicella sp. BE140]MDR6822550.1 2-dehydro-3-deoxyphosphogluconate aldolase/(4S)-4-hydroxy-2-oxoglutarate aldolase [Arcicella sp. BE139]